MVNPYAVVNKRFVITTGFSNHLLNIWLREKSKYKVPGMYVPWLATPNGLVVTGKICHTCNGIKPSEYPTLPMCYILMDVIIYITKSKFILCWVITFKYFLYVLIDRTSNNN